MLAIGNKKWTGFLLVLVALLTILTSSAESKVSFCRILYMNTWLPVYLFASAAHLLFWHIAPIVSNGEDHDFNRRGITTAERFWRICRISSFVNIQIYSSLYLPMLMCVFDAVRSPKTAHN